LIYFIFLPSYEMHLGTTQSLSINPCQTSMVNSHYNKL